jgi:pSer/pThr/pTyr-binding forkhead associated (FHA) protein
MTTITCPRGHRHDSAWSLCPYCDDSVIAAVADRLIPVGWFVVLGGAEHGRDIRIDTKPLVIGSDSNADVILRDEYISGRHVRIEGVLVNQAWKVLVTDLGSTNGTYLGTETDERIQQEELGDGDILVLGSTPLRLKLLDIEP